MKFSLEKAINFTATIGTILTALAEVLKQYNKIAERELSKESKKDTK